MVSVHGFATTLNKNFQNTLKCLNKKLPKPLKNIAKKAFIIYLRYWKIICNYLCLDLAFVLWNYFIRTWFLRYKHCVKSVFIRSFFWSESRKIRTGKNSVFENFSRSEIWYFITTVTRRNTLKLLLQKILHRNYLRWNHFFPVNSAQFLEELFCGTFAKGRLIINCHVANQKWN